MQPKQPSPKVLLEFAQAIEPTIRMAGSAILDVYARPDHAVRTKEDRSPVTDADVASHDLLTKALAILTPEWPVVSEEDIEPTYRAAGIDTHAPFWLLDPLDGTKEFIARTGEFSINLGLVVNQQAHFGLLYSPVDQVLFRGGVGMPAEIMHGWSNSWAPIACRPRPATGGVLIASRRSTSVPEGMTFDRRDDLGSALKFGRIAQGLADYYLRRGPTMEWDTCAGQAILEAAGGSFTTIDGQPMRYGKPDWLNGGFIAQGVR
jgi:3'(2'), 5'-bisphosphate nucleotidase